MRNRIIAFLLSIAALFGGIFAVYQKGKSDNKAEQTKQNLNAARDAKDKRNELESQDDQRLIDVLSGRVRDDDR